jgi:TRAP-type C4-dicarboxylate transport system permease small subunit
MKKIMNTLAIMDKAVLATLRVFSISCFVLLTILLAATVLTRFIPLGSLLWSEEIITLLLAYLVFFGAAALWIGREHFSAGDWLSERIIKNQSAIHIYRLILEVLVLIFAALFFYFSLMLTIATEAVTNVLAMPRRYFYVCMPISAGLMIIYSIRNIILEAFQVFQPKAKETKK